MYKVEITIGHKDRNQTPLDSQVLSEAVRTAATRLAQAFGGATCSEARGYWTYDDGTLGCEDTSIVYAYAMDKPNDELWFQVARAIATDTNQEAVMLAITELNGTLAFCEAKVPALVK